MASNASTSFWARTFPRAHADFAKFRGTSTYKFSGAVWRNKRWIFVAGSVGYTAYRYQRTKQHFEKVSAFQPNTYLVWKFFPGSVVETRTATSIVSLASSSPTPGQITPQVITLFDAIHALENAAGDPNIRGLIADFSAINQPANVTAEGLGLAQIEELQMAIWRFQQAKCWQFPRSEHEKPKIENDQSEAEVTSDAGQQGPVARSLIDDRPATIAFADTFASQGAFLLASAFEKVYLQPSGSLPLTGIVAQLPFFARLLERLGIKTNASARREYKSMVSAATQEEGLTKPQLENEAELFGELNRSVAYSIGVHRFPDLDPEQAADRVVDMMSNGPYTARQAKELGLIDDVFYKGEVYKTVNDGRDVDPFNDSENRLLSSKRGKPLEGHTNNAKDDAAPKKPKTHFRTLPEYSAGFKRTVASLSKDSVVDVAALWLRGTISNSPGADSASSVVRGIREAALDDKVRAIVLRIDSGGGDVVASDTVWHAIQQARESSNKPVFVSFGNVAASGAYYAATAADIIYASESTITGSIGVASLSPTVSRKVLDQAGIAFQTFYTGAKGGSVLHEPDPDQKARREEHIDEIYADFLQKVIDGRGISPDRVEEIAGGRVFTGLVAWQKTCSPRVLLPEHLEQQRALVMAHGDFAAEHAIRLAEHALGLETTQAPAIKGDSSRSHFWTAIRASAAFGPNDLSEWELQAINGSDELNAQRIIMKAVEKKGQASVVDDNIPSAAESASDALQRQAGDSTDTAEAAHLEATLSRARDEDAAAGNAAASAASVPFGRGLVDGIGGMWEAVVHAANTTLNDEVQELMRRRGVSLAEARDLHRRKAVIGEEPPSKGGMHSLFIRLRTYPRHKTFKERLQEVLSTQMPPDATIGAVIGDLWLAVRNEMSTILAQALVKVVDAVAQDPTAAITELGKRLEASVLAQKQTKTSMEYDGSRPSV